LTTTPREKDQLILNYRRLVAVYCASSGRMLSREDREEMRADCYLAVSRAIDKHDPERGASLETLISRYVERAIASFLRTHGYNGTDYKQAAFERVADDDDCTETSATDNHDFIDLETVIDKVEREGIIDERESSILRACEQGYRYREIGAMMGGVSRQRIEQLRTRAIDKIKGAGV